MGLRGALSERYRKAKERKQKEKEVYEVAYETEYAKRRKSEVEKQAKEAARRKALKPAGSITQRIGRAAAAYERRRATVAKKKPIDYTWLVGGKRAKKLGYEPVKKKRKKRNRKQKSKRMRKPTGKPVTVIYKY